MKLQEKHVGIITILGSLFLLHNIWGAPMKTKAMPVALLVILLVLGAVLILRRGPAGKAYRIERPKEFLSLLALFLGYILLLRHIGFILVTSIFLTAFLLIYRYEAKPWVSVLFSVSFSLIAYWLFAVCFHIRLPEILF